MKLTAKQRAIMERMAEGWTIKPADTGWDHFLVSEESRHFEIVTIEDIATLYDADFITRMSGGINSVPYPYHYEIADAGRAALKEGE